MPCLPEETYFSCAFHIHKAVGTFEGAASSFSFPFEDFDEIFVTKSGIVVVVIESSRSSTTVARLVHSARQPIGLDIRHLRSGLTSGFFLKEVDSSSPSSSPSPPKLRSFVSLEPEVRRGVQSKTTKYSLFSAFPSLSILAFFLCLLASTLLSTFLLCGDAWDNIVKWVVDNSNRFYLWWAMGRFQGPVVPHIRNSTY